MDSTRDPFEARNGIGLRKCSYSQNAEKVDLSALETEGVVGAKVFEMESLRHWQQLYSG